MNILGKDVTMKKVVHKVVSGIMSRLYWPYYDMMVKRDVLRIMRGQADERDEIRRRQLLVRTLSRAYKRVPYWKHFSHLNKVTVDNVVDVLHQLPLLDKNIIRQNGRNMHIQADMSSYGKGYTGGTTGKPLEFYYGRSEETSHQLAMYEYMTGLEYHGNLDRFGKIVTFCGTRPKAKDVAAKKFWTTERLNIYGSIDFCSLYLQNENMAFYIAKLNEIKPVIIRGYSNAILKMAKAIKRHGGLAFSPKGIYVTSEYCSKEAMQEISECFGAPTFGAYGQNEACLFAWTKANDDIYYCSPYYGFVEVLDEQKTAVALGGLGEVVVTAFGNDVMPFIRYRTGDLVRYGGEINGVVILEKLMGRNNDYIVNKDGTKVYLSGYIDIHYLKCSDRIKQYQIQQDMPGSVIFRIVKESEWIDEDEQEIRRLFDIEKIVVNFRYVNDIPLTANGKQVRIIQNLI